MSLYDSVKVLKDAIRDAISWDDFLHKDKNDEVVRRKGPPVKPLNYYLDYLESIPSIIRRAIDNTVIDDSPFSDALIAVDGSLSQRTINKGLESIADLATINNPKTGLRLLVKSYHAGLYKGGGFFTYNSNRESENDGGLVINGWVREFDGTPVNPNWFGAKGDGAYNNTSAFRGALNTGLNISITEPDAYYLITDTLHVMHGQTITGWSKVAKKNYIDGVNVRGVYGEMEVLGTPLFQLGDGTDTELRKMTFNNLTAICRNGPCVKSNYSTEFAFYSCELSSKNYHAIETVQTYLVGFYTCAIGASGTIGGEGLEPAYAWQGMDNSNGISFYNCRMTGGSEGGVADIGKSYNVMFVNCVYESSKHGIRVAGNKTNPNSGNVNNFQMLNCQFENSDFPISLGAVHTVNSPVISGLYITHPNIDASEYPAIQLGRVQGLKLDGLNTDLGLNQYVFELLYDAAAANSGDIACLTNSRIDNMTLTNADKNNLFKHTGYPNNNYRSVLASNKIIIDGEQQYGIVKTHTTERINCNTKVSKYAIERINNVVGGKIVKIEIIGIQGVLSGTIAVGTNVSWSENAFINVSTLNSELGIADVKPTLSKIRAGEILTFGFIQDNSNETGSFRVKITYVN